VRELARAEPENPAWYVEWFGARMELGDPDGAEDVLDQALARIEEPEARLRLLNGIAQGFLNASRRERARELLDQALEIEADSGKVDILETLSRIAREEHDHDEVERLCREILDERPRSFDGYWGLWGTLRNQERFSDAILKFRSLIAKTPDHPLFYEAWMEAALRLGDEEETQRAFRELLSQASSDSTRSGAWSRLAWTYDRLGHAVRALEYRQKEAEFGDDNSFGLGRALYRLGRLDEAETIYVEYTRESSDIERGVKQELFDVLRDLGKTEQALRHAERWIEVRPADPQAHVAVIEIHLIAGREGEAHRVLTEGLEFYRRPEDEAWFLVLAARPYNNSGRHRRAEELVRQALSLGRTDEIFWYWGFLLGPLMDQQLFAEAEETLERIKTLRGGRLAPWHEHQRTRLALSRGDADAAVRLALEALGRQPLVRTNLMSAAEALAAAGRFDEAEPHAREALALNPDYTGHRLLAWILIAGDIDLDEGLELAEKGRTLRTHWSWPAYLAANPWVPSLDHALGLAHLKQGRPAEAVPLLEKAAALQPGRSLVREHLKQARR
jgi:tetratricopeptide (TPR) repeat protein